MSKIAFLFPGQGAQKAGMGQDFYEKYPSARQVFDQASQWLSLDMKALCFEKNDRLNLTEYTQAALVTTCLAMEKVVEECGLHPDITAGLSLGEYCAIAVSGGMSVKDAIVTVRKRGILMEHAVPAGEGSMAAVIGLDADKIQNAIAGTKAEIANYNCPGQIVITGPKPAVEEASVKLKEAGARRVLSLAVSGPFHSPMMKPAGEELKKVFASVSMNPLLIPYVANINAEVITDCGRIEDLLVQQVSGSVRWQQSVETMIREGVDTFVEIGPGKTLTGFLRKIDKNVRSYHIGTWEEALSVCEELESGRR